MFFSFLYNHSAVENMIGAANTGLAGGAFSGDKRLDMNDKIIEACLDAESQTFTLAVRRQGQPDDEPSEVLLRDNVPASQFPARIGICGHMGTEISLLHEPV